MTLILTYATPNYLLQVSDRLVTQGNAKPFDPASNKNVIYHAKNAIATIGYSGPAYMDGTTTDRWIAEKLRGEKFRDHEPGRPWALQIGRAERWLDIGQSIELLRRESAEVFCRLPASQRTRHHIVVAGWQWRRRQDRFFSRPFLCEIRNGESKAERHAFTHDQVPRYWHWAPKRPAYLSSIPDQNPLSRCELDKLKKELRSAWQSPQASVNVLIGAIRFAAQKSPTVGPDCMVVYMPMPSLRLVKAGYVAGESQQSPSASGFSPWIVGPYSVSAPCKIVGEPDVLLGPITVSLSGPSSVTGWPPGFPEPPDEFKSLVPNWANSTSLLRVESQRRRQYP